VRLRRVAAVAVLLAAMLIQPVGAQGVPQAPLVAIDPGHGGRDGGASGRLGGKEYVEAVLALATAKRLDAKLRKAGYRTLLTRTTESNVNASGKDLTGDGVVDVADDLQARVDLANRAGATILVSVHFNGSTFRQLRGPEIYYSGARPFSAENKRLADSVHAAVTETFSELDSGARPRGVLRDAMLGGHLFLLGPAGGRIARASTMPGVLVEGLFLTNERDLQVLGRPDTLERLASAYFEGISAYLGRPPAPSEARVISPNGANLRPSPLLNTTPLTVLPPGTVVRPRERVSGDEVAGAEHWWRVDIGSRTGFVFEPLLDVVPSAQAPAATRGSRDIDATSRAGSIIDDDGLPARARARPRLDAPILFRVPAGATVEIIGVQAGELVGGDKRWMQVRHGASVGWVWAPLIAEA